MFPTQAVKMRPDNTFRDEKKRYWEKISPNQQILNLLRRILVALQYMMQTKNTEFPQVELVRPNRVRIYRNQIYKA